MCPGIGGGADCRIFVGVIYWQLLAMTLSVSHLPVSCVAWRLRAASVFRLAAAAVLLFAAGPLSALTFRHWSSADGLPDDCVRSLSLSADGRLWLRTPAGLCLFDGARFRSFTLDVRRVYRWATATGNVYRDYIDSSGRLWLKSPGYLAVFDTRTERYVDDIGRLLDSMGLGSRVDDLFFDGSGNVLYCVHGGDMRYWSASRRQLLTLKGSRGYRPAEMATVGGVCHILCSGGRLLRWNVASRSFVAADTSLVGRVSPWAVRQRLCVSADGALWLSIPDAVMRRDPSTGLWRRLWEAGPGDGVVTDLVVDAAGVAWFSSSVSGLHRVDGRSLSAERVDVALPEGGAVGDPVQCLLATADGGLWTGHLSQGVCLAHPRMFPFRHECARLGSVRQVLEEADGTLLIATQSAGVVRFNPSTGSYARAFDWLPDGAEAMCLYRDTRHRLWVGTYRSGFYVADGGRVTRYDDMFPAHSATDHIARAVCDDGLGHIFVSVGYAGVGLLDEATGRVSQIAARQRQIAPQRRDVGIRRLGRGLLAVYGEQGLYYYNVKTGRATVARNDSAADLRHYGNYTAVGDLLTDSRSLVWTATDGGLRVWDGRAGALSLLTTAEGLYADHVASLCEDADGRVWAMTDAGINCITVARADDGSWRFAVRAFGRQSGLWGGRGLDGAMVLTASGEIYAGAERGFYRFLPAVAAASADGRAATLLTDIEVCGRRLASGTELGGRVPLDAPLWRTEEIRLRHDENFLTLYFARPDFVSGARHRYRYRMEGVDADWVVRDFGGEGFASYTALAPGSYTFEVADEDGGADAPVARLRVVILPPWYLSAVALAAWAALAAVAAWWIWRLWRQRRRQKRLMEELRERERRREEMNEMKFRFFTNVSHEFRTPLTLIMTPLSRIIARADEPLRRQLQPVYDHAASLLEMINRLLDFRKVEMGGETLRPSRCEVVALTRMVSDSFADVCRDKGISMGVRADCGSDLAVWLDQNKLRHVLSNLYSNAVKFTPRGGHVLTTIAMGESEGRPVLLLDVSDTGRGMAPGECGRVFDRFYQTASTDETAGSGIGLHIVRRYVELHGGTVSAESAGEGLGCTFHIVLPMTAGGHAATPQADPQETAGPKAEPKADGRKRVLVVEDNDDFRAFLADSLAADYEVTQAANGEEGWEAAVQAEPDIIVTDLMMPVMDGLALCSKLKSDLRTSHVPVVLLTARASDEARIEGYKVGADSYIAKPFNYDVLETRLKTLLDKSARQRAALGEAMARGAAIEPSEVVIAPIDEDYLKRAVAVVEEHIADSEFSVAELGEALGASRSQIYRKFDTLAGIKPADFIRQVRLRRAAQLLRSTQLNVQEIAYRTGFNFIRYFNKHFKDMYSMTPTDYRARAAKEDQ